MQRLLLHRSYLSIILILVSGVFAFGETRYHEPGMTGGDITVVTTSPNRGVTRLQFTNPVISREYVTVDGESFTDIWIEGESHTTEPGHPSLPVVNRQIGIPDRGNVQLIINSAEYTEETGLRIYPFQGMEEEPNPQFRYSREFYNQNTWYPAEIATLGEPAVFRDVRIATVSICPIQVNPATGTVRTYHNIDVSVVPVPGQGINEKIRSFVKPSRLFMPMYRELANFQYLELDEEPASPGTYLIICSDDTVAIEYAEQLAQWKRRKGIPTRVATKTQTGDTYTLIKQYIQRAYSNWDPPLEFVCIMGDALDSPADPYHIPVYGLSSFVGSDHPYTQLAGDDILGDIAIGRLSAHSQNALNVIVTKTLKYEQDPYVSGPDWFTKGYLTVGTTHDVTSATCTMEYIRTNMYETGYREVLLHSHLGHINATLMRQTVDSGRSIYFARPVWLGEFNISDLDGLSNGWMLPFVFVITCGTGNFAESTALSEAWLRHGSAISGGGAIGCIGTMTSGNHTRFLNTMAAGIGHSFFVYGEHAPGVALMEGKWQVYRNYYSWESSSVENTINWHNLMGDPEVPIWTAFPSSFDVTFPAEIPLGCNRVPVRVDDDQGNPVEEALVCLMKGEETWTRAYTDDSGYLEMPTNVETEGDLWLTVSKPNFITYTADIVVTQQAICLAYAEVYIDDDNIGGTSGNGDCELNPGETVDLTVTIHNFGNSLTATDVVGTMSSSNPDLAQVVIDQQPFPNIGPGLSAQSQGAFRVEISLNTQNQDVTPLLLSVASTQQTDITLVALTVVSGKVTPESHRFLLSNNRLDPGETEELAMTVRNVGNRSLTNVQGHLFTTDSRITFPVPNAVFGTIAIDDTVSNAGNPFEITADRATIPGHPVTLGVALNGDDGFRDTVYVYFEVGLPQLWDPTGPDHYGYYCFDNTDTSYEWVPTFDWIEVDPDFGGSGEHLPLVDSIETTDDNVVRALPFTFGFYGVNYDTITVCSNGWAAFGNQPQFKNFRNYHIPGPDGPDAMLAAFWDELVVGDGHVCWEYIETDDILVIEWSRVTTESAPLPETFEIILYDPAQYPTPTGDGLIKYQYLTIDNVPGRPTDNPYGTVGIENHNQLDGLEITYWDTYAPGAAPLYIGRAYLFTTLESNSSAEIEEPPAPLEYSLGQNYPNPFNPTTTIPYAIREAAHVKLTVFNLLGQRVTILVDEPRFAGSHQAVLDVSELSSGIYFYRLEAGSFTQTRKMVLLR